MCRGPFRQAQRDISGLKQVHQKLDRELSDLFDVIDVNGNNYLEQSEVLVLATVCGCTQEDAAAATSRFFREMPMETHSERRMSRRQWFLFFHYLISFNNSKNEGNNSLLEGRNLDSIREALSDLAAECSAEIATSSAKRFAYVGYASIFHTLVCAGLLIVSFLAVHLAKDVDVLYASLFNSTASNSTGFKQLEDSIFSNFFAQSANVLFITSASFGALIGIFLSSQIFSGYRHAKRRFGLFAALTGLLSSVILALSCLQYLQIGNGKTMCLQACGSICADTFVNSSADDFLTCQAIVNENCSCGLTILKGRSFEQQTIDIFGTISEATSDLFLKGNFSITFDGYTSREMSINTTPEALARSISNIRFSKSDKNSSTLGSVYGPVAAISLEDKPRHKKWRLMFKGCFENLGKPFVDLSALQLSSNNGVKNRGVSILSAIDILETGRPGTEFHQIQNSFNSAFSYVAVVGVLCSSALGLTSLLSGVLGCPFSCCYELRGSLNLGKIRQPHTNSKLGIIRRRFRKIFEGNN